MNKLLAFLGLITLVAVGGLFFFAGFFTGSTVPLTLAEQKKVVENADKISMSDVEKTINNESASLSEKIQKILGVNNEEPKEIKKTDDKAALDESQISINSLLKEIAASHTIADDCSVDKTQKSLQTLKTPPQDTLEGKRIVFVGYFKTNVALQIQRLLLQKGYKVHVEESRTSNHESFVFCGPFKERKNAELLVTWLNHHDFADARIVKVERDTLEETLYDASADNSDMPANAEKDIPETTENELKRIQQQLHQQQQQLQQQQVQQQMLMQRAQQNTLPLQQQQQIPQVAPPPQLPAPQQQTPQQAMEQARQKALAQRALIQAQQSNQAQQ